MIRLQRSRSVVPGFLLFLGSDFQDYFFVDIDTSQTRWLEYSEGYVSIILSVFQGLNRGGKSSVKIFFLGLPSTL